MSGELSAEEKRKARQAKLLAKSQDRLAKITGAAGADRIISENLTKPLNKPTPTAAPPIPTSITATLDDDDPAEVDISQQLAHPAASPPPSSNNLNDPFGFQNLFPQGQGQGGPEGDIMAQMMQQMMAGMAGGGGPGGPGAGGPFGVGAQGSQPQPPTSPFPAQPKSLLDKLFPLVHLLSMFLLAAYAVISLEPANKVGLYGWMGVGKKVDWNAWAALIRKRPTSLAPGKSGLVQEAVGQLSGIGLAQVPLLWLFVSVELVLQTTRLFLVRNRPAPPGILNSILPILSQFSPQLATLIHTSLKWVSLLSIIINDLAVLIFCIGIAVVVGHYKTGGRLPIIEEIVDGAGAGWNAARAEL
ncbi:hypothetical protein T439DRAFT_324265 [Meredithblackwellia eburnea MCA 4105]